MIRHVAKTDKLVDRISHSSTIDIKRILTYFGYYPFLHPNTRSQKLIFDGVLLVGFVAGSPPMLFIVMTRGKEFPKVT